MHRHLTKFLNLTNQSHEKQFGFKKTLWPLFMDGIQLPQGYRTTTRRQFNFSSDMNTQQHMLS